MKKAKSFSIRYSNYTFIIILFLFLAVLVNSCSDRSATTNKGVKNPHIEYLTTRDGRPAIQIYTVLYIVIDDYDKWIPVLYERKDFNAIEKHIYTLLDHKDDEAKAYELYIFYRSLARGKKGGYGELMKNVLDEWCNTHQNSHIPWLVRGAFYLLYDHPGVSAAHAQAQKDLEKARDFNPSDPNSACFLVELAKVANFPREQMEQYYSAGTAACPFHFGLHDKKFEYLTPRWHGSTEEMMKFADECSMLSEQYPYLGLITVLALEEIHDHDRKKENYLGSDDVWERVETIYKVFFAKYPDDIRGRFFYTYHAYKAQKYDIACEQFEIIGDQWMEETPWGSLVEYNNSRARAYIFKGENLLLEKKLYQLSIDFWGKAVRCNPDDYTYFRLGQAYMYTGLSKWNLSYMLIGEEMLTKAVEYKGPSSKYADEELQKLRETIKQYGKITTRRVSDDAGILAKYDARRFEEQLGWIFDESDIDIRFVFVKDTGAKTIEQLAVEKVQELGIGGKSREERGVLLLYDLKNKELRVEVGYGLEKYFPDAFVGYLVHFHTRDFFSGGDLPIGLQWLIRMLHHRIREQTLGNNFDPRIVEVIKNQRYLSGGAGVSAYVPADGKNKALFLSKLEDKERRYYCAQPTPQAVYEKFLIWLAAGKFDPRIEIFTQQSQIYLSSLPITRAYFHYILMQEYGRSYNFYIKDNLALQYFTDDPLVAPRSYIRTSAGWQMDIMAELRDIRGRVGCIYTWDYAGISDIYTRAFADKLVNIKNYIRIKDGDNRELPLRNSPQ